MLSPGSARTHDIGISFSAQHGSKMYDYAGDLPAPSTTGSVAILGQNIDTEPGDGVGNAERAGDINCGEEVA